MEIVSDFRCAKQYGAHIVSEERLFNALQQIEMWQLNV